MKLRVHVYNPSLEMVGVVDTWESLEIVIRYNAGGNWVLKMPSHHPQAALLREGRRVVFYADTIDGPVDSGIVRKVSEAVSEGQAFGTLTISGINDTARLGHRLAWPNPDAAIGAQTGAAHYVDSGDAEDVALAIIDANAGSSAISGRPIPSLVVPSSASRGSSVAISTRFDNLLDVVSSTANAGGIGIRVIQNGDALNVVVTEPAALPGRFSPKIGNISEWDWSITSPSVTRGIVAGQGEGTARTFIMRVNSTAETDWHEHIEAFVDARDTNDSTTLQARGDELLTDGTAVGGLSQTAIDIPGMAFGVDYNLGDNAEVDLNGLIITDVIREVKIEASSTTASITPSVGDPDQNSDTPTIYRAVRRYRRRLDRLERRK